LNTRIWLVLSRDTSRLVSLDELLAKASRQASKRERIATDSWGWKI